MLDSFAFTAKELVGHWVLNLTCASKVIFFTVNKNPLTWLLPFSAKAHNQHLFPVLTVDSI